MHYRPTPLAAALALAFLAPLPTVAQTSQDNVVSTLKDEQALPTVTVNASADASAGGLPEAYAGGQVARGGRVGFLGNKDFLDTPFNTTSYTQELIKDQQARSVADVLQNDPSVRMARGFGNFQESYTIRGFTLNSDDLAYNGLYGLLPRQYVAMELLERVEVLRGASAFLNGMTPGSSGLGGTINLLPKRATSDPISQATFGWETGGQTYIAADIGRRFGPDERFGIRVNAARREGGTAVSNENRDLGLMSVGLDYRGNSFRLSADVGYQEQKLNQARPNLTVSTFIPALPDNSVNAAQPWSYSNERDYFGTLRAEIDLSEDVTAWAAYGTRIGTENNSLSPTAALATNGLAATYRADNTRVDYIRTGEAGVRAKFALAGVKHEVSATANIFSLDKKNSFSWSAVNGLRTNIYSPVVLPAPVTTTLITSGGDMSDPRTTGKTELTSFALADTVSMLNDRLQVTAGARYQNVKDIGYAYYTSRQTTYYNEGAVTPLLAAVYKLSKNLSVYGNYVEGLQRGDTAPATALNAGQIFSPYKARQKEAGLKYDGGNIGGSLAVFTITKPNYIGINNYYSPNGEQRNRGAELSIFGTPVRGLRLLGGVTLLDAKQTRTLVAGTEGKDAPGVPTTQANIGTEWDIPGIQGLSVNGRVVYTSSQYVNTGNTLEIPSWTRLDGGVRYLTTIGSQVVTIRARVDNLLNRNYWASATSASSNYLVQGSPRTVSVSAAVDF